MTNENAFDWFDDMAEAELEPLKGALPPDDIISPKKFYETGLAECRSKLDEYRDHIAVLADRAASLEISDSESHQEAIELGSEFQKYLKAIDAKRKELVAAPNEYVKSINNMAKAFSTSLETGKDALARKIGDYSRKLQIEAQKKAIEEQKAREREEAKLQAALKKIAAKNDRLGNPVTLEIPKLPPAPTAPPAAPPKTVRTESGAKATSVERWAFEIQDEAQLPREYLIPNDKAIRQAVASGVRNIAGVRIFLDTSIRF
jgi:hypothetical protein